MALFVLQGTEWPIRLGRVDSSDGGAGGRIPSDDAPVSEIVGFMKQLGAKPGGSCDVCVCEAREGGKGTLGGQGKPPHI